MDPIIVRGIAEAPFPNTYSTAVLDAVKVVRAHIPSITCRVEEAALDSPAWDEDGEYIGDLRECACGEMLDGFYSYADHLIAVFGGESHLAT
jgi:hypothetical protein